jgi:hypothetical protein
MATSPAPCRWIKNQRVPKQASLPVLLLATLKSIKQEAVIFPVSFLILIGGRRTNTINGFAFI